MLKKLGATLLELMVSVSIIMIFFVIITSTLLYFYQFPPFDIFKDSSTYRTIFFELSKTIKEANQVKNIYNTPTRAIYLEVNNYIYAYRLNKSTKRLEKSIDGGYTWFLIPNTSNIEEIVFKTSTPPTQAKLVYISYKTFYPNSKLTRNHQFLVKIRKETQSYFLISGINNDINSNVVNLIEHSYGNIGSFQPFTPISNRTSLNTLNLDTFISSYNIVAPVRISTTSTYQLWKFSKNSINESFIYDFVDTIQNFTRDINTTPGSDNDWIKVISVGNYLYTAYAVQESIYNSSSGSFENYYSVYFAYRKLISGFPGPNTGSTIKASWMKKRIFSIRRADIGRATTGTIRFVRIAYGNAAGYNIHITFCVGTTALSPAINDFYYAGSIDGKNWYIINIDKKIYGSTESQLNPLFVIPLIGNLSGTTNQLHFIFVNWRTNTGNDRYRIAYLSTNDLNNFSTIQEINISNPTYMNTDSPIQIRIIRDLDATIDNNGIHIVFSISGQSQNVWSGNKDKLIYMRKNNFNNPAIYNVYPTGNVSSLTFSSVSISIGGGYVNIIANSGTNNYYIRQTITNSLNTDFLDTTFLPNNTLICIDSTFVGSFLHVSAYNLSTGDLEYIRISNPASPVFERINNQSIDDNLTNNTRSIDSQILLTSDNIDNGVMNGIAIGQDNYLHILTYSSTSSSLGEVIYIYPNNPTLTVNNSLNTLLVHDSIPYYRSINASAEGSNFVISYCDNNSNETSVPVANSINDIKLNINGFTTEIDGNRRFDINNSTDIDGSRSCGFYNDVKIVNGIIYVAYSELISGNLRLRFAKSVDGGQSWQVQTANSSNAARDINLQANQNFINIVHRNSLNQLIITKYASGTWSNYQPIIAGLANYNIRTFLDNTGKLHILSFSSNDPNPLVIKTAYYRVFNNNTNLFENSGLTNDDLLLTYNNLFGSTFSSIGPYGDIFVDTDGTVYIVVNTVRIGQTNYGLDLLIYKNGSWQSPIRLPSSSSPLNYLLTSLRINKW